MIREYKIEIKGDKDIVKEFDGKLHSICENYWGGSSVERKDDGFIIKWEITKEY